MITPNTAVAICTLINICIVVLNFIMAVQLVHLTNNTDVEDNIEEADENE